MTDVPPFKKKKQELITTIEEVEIVKRIANELRADAESIGTLKTIADNESVMNLTSSDITLKKAQKNILANTNDNSSSLQTILGKEELNC